MRALHLLCGSKDQDVDGLRSLWLRGCLTGTKAAKTSYEKN
jgi:hypothetical protein